MSFLSCEILRVVFLRVLLNFVAETSLKSKADEKLSSSCLEDFPNISLCIVSYLGKT